MRCNDSSSEGWRAALRDFARIFLPRDQAQVAAYIAASLLAALAGSVAALFLAALIQPSTVLPFAGRLPRAAGSFEAHAALFAIATGAFALLRWSAACLGARLASRCGMLLRREVHTRLIRAKLASLADSSSAEIANVLTYNVEVVVHGFSAALQLLVAIATTVVTLGFALWMAPPLLLALPVLAAFAWMAARLFGREQSLASRDYVAGMTHLFWRGEDFPRRLRHVRSFGRDAADDTSYAAIAAGLARGYRRQLQLAAHGRLLLELLAAAAIAAAFLLAHRWSGLGQANLVAVCLLLGRLLPYLASTRQGIQQLRSAAPALGLWRRYMALEPESEPPSLAHSADGLAANGLAGTLRIGRVRLPPSIVALDVRGLVLAPGELTLVCGDSGIGKSCLVDVLAGMMEPAGFEADVGGRAIGFDEYRALVGTGAYVSQQVRPWHASVRESLRWAAPEASDAGMWQALADVGLDRRLHRTDRGLDTALQESGSRFSGGELQRLMLAQVLLRQPALAILDEATGALDAASEREVLSTLRRRLPHAAIVVVSHRTGLASMAAQSLEIDGSGVANAVRRRAEPARDAFASALER
jgi:ATP-binding cassette subfamily C protein